MPEIDEGNGSTVWVSVSVGIPIFFYKLFQTTEYRNLERRQVRP